MAKRSVLSFVLVSTFGSVILLTCSGGKCFARTLDNVEAERLTYSALVSDSDHVTSYQPERKTAYIPKKSNRTAAKKGASVQQVAYRPKSGRRAEIKRAVYHQATSHLLSSLGRLRNG